MNGGRAKLVGLLEGCTVGAPVVTLKLFVLMLFVDCVMGAIVLRCCLGVLVVHCSPTWAQTALLTQFTTELTHV